VNMVMNLRVSLNAQKVLSSCTLLASREGISSMEDIRFMGNLSIQIPFTAVCLSVSSFALCGMPLLAGFYSKDLILEIMSFSYVNLISFFLYFSFLLD
jgi:NADH:ubiquinone oxidoreductase subunit 5 (subunit L)/multisubunit Na+/H+ antiporter MnhA subunit